MKNEKTRNHLEHLSAQEYLSSSLLHPSGSVNCDPFGQQQIDTLGFCSTILMFLFTNREIEFDLIYLYLVLSS